jgi:hypothetical protein
MHICPNSIHAPSSKAFVDCIPDALFFWKHPPLRPAAQYPQNGFNEPPTFCFFSCIGTGVLLQKWVDLFPLVVA